MKDATSLNKLWSKPSECIPTTCYHGLLILTSKLSNWLEIQEPFWIANSSSLSTRVYYISRNLDLTNSISKVMGGQKIHLLLPFPSKYLTKLAVLNDYKQGLGRPMKAYIKQIWNVSAKHGRHQGCHGEFEPGKAQYSTPTFFDRLFLIRTYPGLGGLASRVGPGHLFYAITKILYWQGR